MHPEWQMDAFEALKMQQQVVIEDLEEKVQQAPEVATDEYMYQDKQKAEKELIAAKKILDDIPKTLRNEDLTYRTWNPLPYKRYRGSDDPEEK